MKQIAILFSALLIFGSCSIKQDGDTLVQESPLPDHVAVEHIHVPKTTKHQAYQAYLSDSAEVSAGAAVLFIDVDGHYTSGTSWNGTGPITSAPATFAGSADSVAWIKNYVKLCFSMFDHLVVTTDSTLYFAAPKTARMRCVVSPTYAWYGVATGGVSFIGSFKWGDDTPNFAFQIRNAFGDIAYNLHLIAAAIAHEFGHTLGLQHQSNWTSYSSASSGTKTNDYRADAGSGESTYSPIMGSPYATRLSVWSNLRNTYGAFQDDITIIGTQNPPITIRSSQQPKTWQNAKIIASGRPYTGSIDFKDSDYYKFTLPTLSTISVSVNPDSVTAMQPTPFATYSLLDAGLALYDSRRNQITSTSAAGQLGASLSITLNSGTYYICVKPDKTQTNNPTGYGFIGRYSITLSY